jgi:hypothetical protein
MEKDPGVKTSQVGDKLFRVDLPGRFIYLENYNVWTANNIKFTSKDFISWRVMPKKIFLDIIERLKISEEFDQSVGKKVFQPIVWELVHKEKEWLDFYDKLPETLTPQEIGTVLGRDYRYVMKYATKAGFERTNNFYPKGVVDYIYLMEQAIPKDEGWYTILSMAKELGVDREWVENRLKEIGDPFEYRTCESSGIKLRYYSPESFEYVKERFKKVPKTGDSWYTAGRIEESVERSGNWVRNQLKQFEDRSEIRLDGMGVPRRHYPASVMEEISVAANVGGLKSWLTIKQIARKYGITKKSASRKMNKMGVEGKYNQPKNGKLLCRYDPEKVEEAMTIRDGVYSKDDISRAIGRSALWVRTSIDKLEMAPDDVINIGKLRYFSKNVLQILMAESESQKQESVMFDNNTGIL